MKKKYLFFITAIMLLLTGCKNSATETENIVSDSIDSKEGVSQDTDKDTGSPNSINEDQKKDFSTGIDTIEDVSASSDSEALDEKDNKIVINDEIEETCPVSISMKQPDVDYGEYKHNTYFSETCQMERGYNILLPKDYNENKQYPVLYLLHGIFGDENSFPNDSGNRIKEIVGNMAAEGFIDETLVVCVDMYARTDSTQVPGFTAEACLPYDNFINDLVNDLMPHIESTYSVLTGRENTYLAGFSMGGRETIYITLQRPELFGYVCAISAAPGITATTDSFMTHPGQLKEEDVKFSNDEITPNTFIICCGDKDSVVGKYPLSYHELLEKNGVAHLWYEINGADHDNNAIKSGIYNLFKQIAYDKNDK